MLVAARFGLLIRFLFAFIHMLKMKIYKAYIAVFIMSLMVVSCGVDGDPGHCYFSLDWEYYGEDYGVYYYEDDNPDVPVAGDIEPGRDYDCYPGRYDYYYESEDPEYVYKHNGFYDLFQNPGTPGGLLHDGLDGADTYFELYLFVKARKGLDRTGGLMSLPTEQPLGTLQFKEKCIEDIQGKLTHSGGIILGNPLRVETMAWEQTKGNWTLRIEETMKVYKK